MTYELYLQISSDLYAIASTHCTYSRRMARPSWPDWLVYGRYTPEMVIHFSYNWARRRLTSSSCQCRSGVCSSFGSDYYSNHRKGTGTPILDKTHATLSGVLCPKKNLLPKFYTQLSLCAQCKQQHKCQQQNRNISRELLLCGNDYFRIVSAFCCIAKEDHAIRPSLFM